MDKKRLPISVAYTKGNRKKVHIETFDNLYCIDDLLMGRKSLIPGNAAIKDIGIGSKLEQKYKVKYV